VIVVAIWCFAAISSPVFASSQDFQTIHMKGTVRYIVSDGTYGILGENGKKYQPIRLSQEYRHDGLAVVFDAKIRDDLIGARMWGTAVEITQIMKLDQYISAAENEAIRMLLLRMDAFDTRDLGKLQKIDIVSRGLSEQEFNEWLGFYGNFTLRYVEITDAEPGMISGLCLYSRELVNAMALSGNVKRTLLCFTLNKLDGEWKFTSTWNYRPSDPEMDLEQYATELEERGKSKYGTDNLAQIAAKH
jgi:hypothetical protein